MIKLKQAFTFVELIVVITIMGILTSIGFYSYIGYLGDTRDSQRKTDLSQVASALKIYKQKRGSYALPGNTFNITFSGTTIAKQGKLNKNVRLNTLEILPVDPKIKEYYGYSVTTNKQEFEITATLENSDVDLSLVIGNYKSVSVNVLPTLLLALATTDGANISVQSGTTNGDINRKLFIYNSQKHNLAYTFIEPYKPYTDGITFTDLKNEMINSDLYWQNSDFRNCLEINEGLKLLIPLSSTSFEYQIVTSTGALTNTGCTL